MSGVTEHSICCPHPLSEHGDDGCLHGWGGPAVSPVGCMCPVRGGADEVRWQ